MDNACIFCKIVSGEIPSKKIWEDDNYVAVLDIMPNIKGQTIVMLKQHTDSYIFSHKISEMSGMMKASKKVARLLEKRLKVKRVHIAFEGTGVNHLHAKLYPAIGFGEGTIPMAEGTVRFDAYPGYVTTQLGPKASDEELEEVQKQLTGK